MRKPSTVTVAGYLLVIPALYAWLPAIYAWKVAPAFGVVATALAVLAVAGLLAVNLNAPAAQWIAASGVIGSALAAVLVDPCGLGYAGFCVIPAGLLLLPEPSRAWFAR